MFSDFLAALTKFSNEFLSLKPLICRCLLNGGFGKNAQKPITTQNEFDLHMLKTDFCAFSSHGCELNFDFIVTVVWQQLLRIFKSHVKIKQTFQT